MTAKGKRMTARWMAALAAAGALWTVQAHAQTADADIDSDVKCLVLGIELTADPDPQLQTPGQLTSLYYMGRLNGRLSPADLQAKILAAGKAMSPADMTAAVQTCTATLGDVGKALAEARDALIKMENEKDQKDAPPPTKK
jgi:hypothetical protein